MTFTPRVNMMPHGKMNRKDMRKGMGKKNTAIMGDMEMNDQKSIFLEAIDSLIEERDLYYQEIEKLREERDQAIYILQSWADDESPWTETWAFLARISKDKEEV
jgi:hypothetical protein